MDLTKSQALDYGGLSILTVAQVEYAAAELANFKPCDVMVRLTGYTGLRAGEVLGLLVRDVDLAEGHVSMRETVQWTSATTRRWGSGSSNAQVQPLVFRPANP
ncbi:hypothetical protein [Microbacterium sp. AG157]|uniref:hypothetical protein n=1 Tax=Microbacterium sp. AG157 TaxID=2183993 RepID=UPI000E28629D|nr:hypothetical protein [Microbacterium sp. AG157]